MNRRNMIVLVAALVVVVGIAGFFIGKAGYSVFSSPSGQSWVHAWIGDPVGLTAIATFALTIATLGAVLIALYGIRDERIRAKEEREEAQTRFERERNDFRAAQDETRRQFLASQQQTQDALGEGRRQFLEAQYATNRPLLVPLERHLDDIPTVIEWNGSVEFINIQNAGTGVATNIWGVFMPPVSR